MEERELIDMLKAVSDGSMSVKDAAFKIKEEPFTDIGYAKLDNHRGIRQGVPEVIYGAGKTKEQILGIAKQMQQGCQWKLVSLCRIIWNSDMMSWRVSE